MPNQRGLVSVHTKWDTLTDIFYFGLHTNYGQNFGCTLKLFLIAFYTFCLLFFQCDVNSHFFNDNNVNKQMEDKNSCRMLVVMIVIFLATFSTVSRHKCSYSLGCSYRSKPGVAIDLIFSLFMWRRRNSVSFFPSDSIFGFPPVHNHKISRMHLKFATLSGAEWTKKESL